MTAVLARLTQLCRVRLVRQDRFGDGRIWRVIAVVYAPARDCPDCAGTGEVTVGRNDPPDVWGEPCWCTRPGRDLTVRIRAVATQAQPEDPPF